MGGFGLEPNLVIGLTTLAVGRTGHRIARWNALDDSRIVRSSRDLMNLAGMG